MESDYSLFLKASRHFLLMHSCLVSCSYLIPSEAGITKPTLIRFEFQMNIVNVTLQLSSSVISFQTVGTLIFTQLKTWVRSERLNFPCGSGCGYSAFHGRLQCGYSAVTLRFKCGNKAITFETIVRVSSLCSGRSIILNVQ